MKTQTSYEDCGQYLAKLRSARNEVTSQQELTHTGTVNQVSEYRMQGEALCDEIQESCGCASGQR